MKKASIIKLVVAVVLVTGIIGLTMTLTAGKAPTKPNDEFAWFIRSQVTDKETVRVGVQELHRQLNKYVGWGNYKVFEYGAKPEARWDEFRENTMLDEEALHKIINGVRIEAVAEDLRTVKALIKIAGDKESVEALRYAHRILHDLDYWVFNPDTGNGDYWGATTTFQHEGDNQRLVKKIAIFIEKNK